MSWSHGESLIQMMTLWGLITSRALSSLWDSFTRKTLILYSRWKAGEQTQNSRYTSPHLLFDYSLISVCWLSDLHSAEERIGWLSSAITHFLLIELLTGEGRTCRVNQTPCWTWIPFPISLKCTSGFWEITAQQGQSELWKELSVKWLYLCDWWLNVSGYFTFRRKTPRCS